VTHDQAEALALSDQIAVMQGGRLQQFGTPREVYARPANRVVADFMGLVNLLPGKVVAADTVAAGPLTLRLSLLGALRAGDIVDVAIRPESIRLGTADGVPARVEEQSYLGNLSEYHVVLADGTRLRVQAPALAEFPVGSTVSIEIDASQCNVFAASDAASDN
jgi:ABC-type Fe3+/spermidine/putrescine transport system ATPase subunit